MQTTRFTFETTTLPMEASSQQLLNLLAAVSSLRARARANR